MGVETAKTDRVDPHAAIAIGMLGPLTVERDGLAVHLPASRKICALLAYLALSPDPVSRNRLCDLLWNLPNDPRGELRWCLSKIRAILDEPGRRRVTTTGDLVRLDLHDCCVDALEVERRVAGGIHLLDPGALQSLAELFRGDFLEGLEVSRSPQFDIWLTAQRRRFRSLGVAVFEQLVDRAPSSSDRSEGWLARWLATAPFDTRAHKLLLAHLVAGGRIRDGEEHLLASARAFEDEDVDFTPVRLFWRSLRAGHRAEVGASPSDGSPVPAPNPEDGPSPRADRPNLRASLAVMPFAEELGQGMRGGFADGLTHDIITRLAKLRNLFIIARGSVFALAERNIGPEEAGRRLAVNYVAGGTVRLGEGKAVVSVEVIEVANARIVWTDVFEHELDDMFSALDDIGNSIVAAIAKEIEAAEQNRAVLKAPDSLNAWEAFHRGLWHMYRFTREDNLLAQRFFRSSLRLDPTFARAHAGMSFTHWQNAFQRWENREEETRLALEAAGQSLLADEHNPSSHWAMGRALWIRGSQEESLHELERAVELSPNFALGHYTLAFVHSQSGDPKLAIGSADQSRHLSPFDPLLFGMLAARGMAHVRLGEFEEAAQWAVTAAARPNAHVIIRAIAAHCLGLAGRIEEGRALVASIRKTHPNYSSSDFLDAFRFSPDAVALFRLGAKNIGLD